MLNDWAFLRPASPVRCFGRPATSGATDFTTLRRSEAIANELRRTNSRGELLVHDVVSAFNYRGLVSNRFCNISEPCFSRVISANFRTLPEHSIGSHSTKTFGRGGREQLRHR